MTQANNNPVAIRFMVNARDFKIGFSLTARGATLVMVGIKLASVLLHYLQ